MKSQEFAITRLGESMLDSPLLRTDFIPDNATVAFDSEAARLAEYTRNGEAIPAFELAGPRAKIYHDPAWCKAAILTP